MSNVGVRKKQELMTRKLQKTQNNCGITEGQRNDVKYNPLKKVNFRPSARRCIPLKTHVECMPGF